MRRRLFIGFLFFLFFYSVYCESIDPQQLIARFEKEAQEMESEKKDSVKNSLLSTYIQDYRSNGKEIASDSLQARINRLLSLNKKNSGKSLEQLKNVEQQTEADEDEIESLQRRNRELQDEIKALQDKLKEEKTKKDKEIKSDIVDLLLVKEIQYTHKIADSLTIQDMEKENQSFFFPIYFDSISHADFFNYINIPENGYINIVFSTVEKQQNSFEKRQGAFLFQNKQKRRYVNSLAITQPELIEFYNLSVYDNKAQDITEAGREIVLVEVEDYKANPVFEKLNKYLKQKKQSLWTSRGKLTIQFSQYYVTKNWYKGGEPNATLLSILEYSYDYNNNDKLIWDNDLDVKIGFFNSRNDTIRAFRVNNDVFKITSRLGYQTFYKKWYYSLSGEFNTTMFTSYDGTNSTEVVTSFLSPARIFMSLGLDYRYSKNTSVSIAPAAYKLIFLVNNEIDPLTVGITEGKSSHNFGYMLQAKLNWKFTREINVNSNFNLFSTYNCKDVEFDWETVGNFIINRYLSTRLSLNMRFDNTPKKTTSNDKVKLQIQEQLSFGFYYKF